MHIALYRKYRSATFDDVCGQDHITSVLKYQAKSGKVSHAYLFCGSRGTGKTSCAKILAKAVNCENPQDGNPCGVCENCRSIDRDNVPDFMEMDAASETGVDYIREIKEEVQYQPAILKKKVYIIDEVHMLTESAFNALLKTLEEPPEHVVFVLATTELHKLPTTVISRCQRFDFRRISVDVICSRLAYIAEKESIFLDGEAAKIIAKQAQGGMRDAISLFELCAGGGADVTEERVREILGVSGYENVHAASLAIAKGDMAALFGIVSGVVSSSKDITVFWQELTSFYRDMLVAKYSKDAKGYLDLTDSEFALLNDAASKFSLAALFYQSKIMDEALKTMNRMPQTKRMTAEFALMKMCDATLDKSTDALLARIDALENTVALLSGGAVPVQTVKAENSENVSAPVPVKAEATVKKEKIKTESAPTVDSTPESVSHGGFHRVNDLTEIAEKVGKTDFLCRSILAEAVADVSDDGKLIKIITDNPFATTYIDKNIGKAISDAFILCKINDKAAEIEVTLVSEGPKKPLSDDLFDNL
ncbi:MAG: DNA polymerase III subunit gamma/tau [Ruminococcaceae bacterium]|nr:DNA polymerase III subunit gamma/tau [Oscillospiraceae bacterium]